MLNEQKLIFPREHVALRRILLVRERAMLLLDLAQLLAQSLERAAILRYGGIDRRMLFKKLLLDNKEPLLLSSSFSGSALEIRTLLEETRLQGVMLMCSLLQDGDFAVCLLDLRPQRVVLLRLLLQFFFQNEDRLIEFFLLHIQQAHLRLGSQSLIAHRLDLARAVCTLLLELTFTLEKFRQGAAPVDRLQLIVAARLLCALGKRFELPFDLLHDVADAHEIPLHVFKLSHRLALAVAVLRDARRFFKIKAALLRLAVQDLINAVLTDDAHAIAPESRIGEKVADILQATARLIDEELALARAEKTARHDDFAVINGHIPFIFKEEGDFCNAHGTPRRTARKDDVLGLRTAQGAHILLAEHPAHRICDVALAAAVRPDNRRNARMELDLDFIGKRFEAVGFEAFQLQNFFTSPYFLHRLTGENAL